jgi:hypothetical protein
MISYVNTITEEANSCRVLGDFTWHVDLGEIASYFNSVLSAALTGS